MVEEENRKKKGENTGIGRGFKGSGGGMVIDWSVVEGLRVFRSGRHLEMGDDLSI